MLVNPVPDFLIISPYGRAQSKPDSALYIMLGASGGDAGRVTLNVLTMESAVKTDPRIMPVEKLDRNRTVLVDAHSLETLAQELTEPGVSSFEISDLTKPGGSTLANIIQNIVLYDAIVVDSLLFQVPYSEVPTACDLFPGVVRGVYLRPGVRRSIGKVIDQIATIEGVGDPPAGISSEEWRRWQMQDSSEKPLMDKMSNVVPDLVPPEYEGDQEIQTFFNRKNPLRADVPLCCLNSMMTLGRAHFYLELSRELGIPLSADPIRSRYFSVLLDELRVSMQKGIPERVVAFFDDQVLKETLREFANLVPVQSVALSIPPIAEFVVNYAKRKRCNLHTATLAVRMSKHAIVFREWCAKFVSLSGAGRATAIEFREMARELQHVCEVWKKDVNEEVRYKTRRLNLEHLPRVGGVLKAINMHEKTIKDPVILSTKPYSYFLFLNDLLQPPT